jgi:cytochrome b subunit of formate dehydrogenase
MKSDSEIRRYGKMVVFEHWLMIILVLSLSFTGLLLIRDWFIHEFHIYGAEMYIPTPSFTLTLHGYVAFGLLILGAIHLIVHVGQREKHILPKHSSVELRHAIYSLMYLVFLTRKQERGSGEKYLRSQRIIYAFTIYVLGLGAITGFLNYTGVLGEPMHIAHITAGVLVILVVVHRIALIIRKRDKVALRSVLKTGTMPEWYVKKNHRAWYEDMVGSDISEIMEQIPEMPESIEEELGENQIDLPT